MLGRSVRCTLLHVEAVSSPDGFLSEGRRIGRRCCVCKRTIGKTIVARDLLHFAVCVRPVEAMNVPVWASRENCDWYMIYTCKHEPKSYVEYLPGSPAPLCTVSLSSRSMSESSFPPADKIYEAQFAESSERLEAYADFVAIVKQLRRDCPWDREQTHESVKHLLIEEAYEVVAAIDERDWAGLPEELGDVFLHVLFHATIAEEEGRFTLAEVIEAETEKLVRRHPHVFGEEAASDPEAVASSWEERKQQEKDGKAAESSVLDGVPLHLPALLRAHRVQEKAAGVGFEFPDREEAWEKVKEELSEFREAVDEEERTDRREAEFGDLLFALVNYARYADVNPENALRETVSRFMSRFQHVERYLSEQGTTIDEADLSEMRRLWAEAKE